MSLRTKLLAIFITLGVAPLLVLGILSYAWSTRALEGLLAERTHAIASRAAEALSQRYARALSDLLFLANNAETQRLLSFASAHGDSKPDGPQSASTRIQVDSIHEEALAFLDTAWPTVGSSWAWAEIRKADGSVVHRLGELPAEVEVFEPPDPRPTARTEYVIDRPILKTGAGVDSVIGSIRGSLLLSEILPRGELEAGFGELGYSLVVDRSGDRLLFHSRARARRRSLSTLFGPGGWGTDPGVFQTSSGTLRFSEEGTGRVASFVSLDEPPWTIISTESPEEFSEPFARTGTFNLFVVILVTAVISGAFVVVTSQATDSLRRLTTAADQVAEGDLEPSLPPGGGDEVGRLAAAFSIMVTQVRSMLRRVEESRHMSAIGEFAAQLSHEIRNPLTSIKLNLQRLDRGIKEHRIPTDYAKAIQLSLKEAKRLDGTVRGVLGLSRMKTPRRRPESLHEVIRSALETLSPQLEAQKIEVDAGLSASTDTVMADRELLKSAFLNLLLNSMDVMDRGGKILIQTETVPAEGCADSAFHQANGVVVRISDDGPGIPTEIRDRVFDPFFTTKEDGSGFGLPLVLRVVEEHSGTLTLADPQPPLSGAAFQLTFPLTGPKKEEP